MFLRDIRHIGKDHREGDGKDAGHGDDCKVPPKRRQEYGFVGTDELKRTELLEL